MYTKTLDPLNCTPSSHAYGTPGLESVCSGIVECADLTSEVLRKVGKEERLDLDGIYTRYIAQILHLHLQPSGVYFYISR